MSELEGESEEKYVLDYYLEASAGEEEPPFRYRTHYLADALVEGHRIETRGGRSLAITRGGTSVLDEGALRRAFSLMGDFAESSSEEEQRSAAERALREMNPPRP